MSDIAVCPECQAKNRLRVADGAQTPRCGRCRHALPWLVNASDATFDRESQAPVPVLVDLWAPWCGPCRLVAPVLDELSRDLAGRLKVIKINVDDNPSLASRFDARSIPTLVILQDGEVRQRLLGVQAKEALLREIEPLLQSTGGE